MALTSGAGERAARLGLRYQDRASAHLAYRAILDGTLTFVALADDHAGMFDDLVIGIAGKVIGHQYKSSGKPKPVGVTGLLLGSDKVIADCAASFAMLESEFPDLFVQLRYVSSHYPTTSDRGKFGVPKRDSADFFRDKARHPDRSLADWRASEWKPLIEALLQVSGLTEPDFERFFGRLEFALGASANAESLITQDAAALAQINDLAHTLGDLVGRNDGRTRWTRRELLDALGWADRFQLRFEHRFPLGAHVQSNEKSEAELEAALGAHASGYLCLLGPPGAGKSTLLERFVQPSPERNVARYLAFIPGEAQGQGRGVDANFLDDLNSQLIGFGYQSQRAKDDTLEQKRETFERLLEQAGKQYAADRQMTVIVVDGLDHVPREERPDASFLRALPLPQSVPKGVLFLLGSQRIDLADIPPEVRDQASDGGRRIEIAPLSHNAVAEMVISVGLDREQVDPAEVFAVSLGHPLVTRYLLGKLLSARPEEREALLAGGFEYDGDLEKVYRQAWREAQGAGADVSKTLFVLSFADGRIEPELLAQWLSSSAVDKAFTLAHHLIDHGGGAWRIFHNSFRLFLRQQRITLYGKPDPAFSDPVIYRGLAELAGSAPQTSVQRFLEFRYRFLAGDLDQAAALVSRRYFVGQFVDGRRSYEVSNDIGDAVVCLGADPNPAALFDLMLARDEIWRRQDALTMAERIVTAQIAAGDLDMAVAQLDSNHVAGDEWLVIDALLDDGQVDRARLLFDSENPWKWFDESHGQGTREVMEAWADLAVVLLEDEQIERRIRLPIGKQGSDKDSFSGRTRDDYLLELRYLLARAIVRHDPDREVTEIATQHRVDRGAHLTILHLESAEAKMIASRTEEALQCVAAYATLSEGQNLHDSWHLHAARIAIAGKDHELARRLFARAAVPDMTGLEHKSDEVENAVDAILGYTAIAAQLGEAPAQPALPKEFLFRGVQAQAVRLGTLIGEVRAERPVASSQIVAQIKASLAFLAGAVTNRHDDVLLGYRLRHADKPLFDAICKLVRLVPDAAPGFAAEFDACLQLPVCSFRQTPQIHRRFAETMFAFDGDAAAAVGRLERPHAGLGHARSPQEAIDLLSELAIAFGNIGLHERARELLHMMRQKSLGCYLAAKKDGLYQLWEGVLTAANRADPSGSADRAFRMLRLTAGVDDSDAHDQAWRMAKSVLVDSIASGTAAAWDAYRWAKESGVWHWDALVDAVTRGILRRRPDLAIPLAITWSALALPYYEEVYNSLTRTGQFLRDLAAAAPQETLPAIERMIVASLEHDAKPSQRAQLLRVFRDGLADRDYTSPTVDLAIDRWNAEPAQDKDALPDYFQLKSFEDVERAVAVERARREAQTSVHYGDFVNYKLGKRIGRIIANKTWEEAEAFAARNPELVRDRPVKTALASAALAAGRRGYAEALFLGGTETRQGWGGWADSNLLNHHRARHLLGCPDAHSRAREDFLRDLAAGGHGTGSALWGVDDIFPLLFEEIDWPALWARLDEQIPEYRDYQKAMEIPRSDGEEADDLDLLVLLFLDAAQLGVSDPLEQAAAGLLELAQAESSEAIAVFSRTCKKLIEGDGPTALFGLRLLFEARSCDGITQSIKNKLNRLAEHQDGCVAVLAEILSGMWGGAAQVPEIELPPIYGLQLPPLDSTTGRSLRDADSLGPVIDDPAAWTEGFESWIEMLADYSGVSVANIRHRAAQLIAGWGGVGAYGANATKELGIRLGALGLRLPFVRPHIGACIRALRVIVGEHWRAGTLSQVEFDLLLHRLDGGPLLPPRTSVSARPADQDWPTLPEERWSARAEDWLQAEGIQRSTGSERVVGEWARFAVLESHSLFTEGLLVVRGMRIGPADDLDGAIGQLPKVFWSWGGVVDVEPNAPSTMLRNLRVSLVGERSEILMFDPVFAKSLGWQHSSDDPFAFLDQDGQLVAATRFWRDGWQQEMSHNDARWAEGQRVELSEAGLAQLRSHGNLPELQILRWRDLRAHHTKEQGSSSWRSGAPPAST